jgi:signal transduction histidine kinase
MPDSPTEYLTLLRRCVEQTEKGLRQTDNPGERAALVAGGLRVLWPTAPLVACRLTHEGKHLHAFNQQNAERGDWVPVLETFLDRHDGDGDGEPPPRYLAALPAELAHPGHSLAVQHVLSSGRSRGALMVAVADDAAPEAAPLLWELLRAYAGWLGAWLALDAARRDAGRLQQAMTEQAELANLAALASPVTHEFNNFLNTLLLQLMVLSSQVPEQVRSDLTAICQQGRAVAALVRQWQQHRAQHRSGPRRLDVNALVRESVGQLVKATAERPTPLYLADDSGPANGIAVRLALADDLPPVEGNPLDLRLAVRFLLTNAAATITGRPGSVSVATRAEGNAVELSFDDTGPPIPAAALPRMFEPSAESREGASSLELAACEALVQRRLRGEIQAENRPEGGARVRVRLRAV